jgi:hypothetical protein
MNNSQRIALIFAVANLALLHDVSSLTTTYRCNTATYRPSTASTSFSVPPESGDERELSRPRTHRGADQCRYRLLLLRDPPVRKQGPARVATGDRESSSH